VRIIFCGSRDWTDGDLIDQYLAVLDPRRDVVIQGAARGADRIAGALAKKRGFKVETYAADWYPLGHLDMAAGHRRNKKMLDLGADKVYAFKDGFDHTLKKGGTENMVKIAVEAGVPATVVAHGVIVIMDEPFGEDHDRG
jgi:hypothetical protein